MNKLKWKYDKNNKQWYTYPYYCSIFKTIEGYDFYMNDDLIYCFKTLSHAKLVAEIIVLDNKGIK